MSLDVESEGGEEREPRVLKDLGRPTPDEVEKHNVTHMPFRSWCPACVAGRARDRLHKRMDGDEVKRVPEIVCDYAFLGSAGDEVTILVLVARDRRTQMIFGLSHEHSARELEMGIRKLGYYEVVLKCGSEPALKSVQEEVRRLRKEPTILDNSRVGDSRANGAAERAVQAIGEQVRVMRYGPESRLGANLKGSHAVTCWLVEHSADVLNKHSVGSDGRTPHER